LVKRKGCWLFWLLWLFFGLKYQPAMPRKAWKSWGADRINGHRTAKFLAVPGCFSLFIGWSGLRISASGLMFVDDNITKVPIYQIPNADALARPGGMRPNSAALHAFEAFEGGNDG
jgi:hypothetical protein